KLPNFFRSLSWSPDGQRLMCAAGSFVPTYNSYLVEVSLEDSKQKQLGTQMWKFVSDVAWAAKGSGLVITASEIEAGSRDSQQLWYVSYPTGESRRITNDLNNYGGVSITKGSDRLVTVQDETASSILVGNAADPDRSTEITAGPGRVDGREGVAWTPD